MGGLKVAMAVMGVLIVGGTGALIALLLLRVPRAGGGDPVWADAVLHEPAGTHIASMSTSGSTAADQIVLLLQGGGPDRIAVVSARTGRVTGRVSVGP